MAPSPLYAPPCSMFTVTFYEFLLPSALEKIFADDFLRARLIIALACCLQRESFFVCIFIFSIK